MYVMKGRGARAVFWFLLFCNILGGNCAFSQICGAWLFVGDCKRCGCFHLTSNPSHPTSHPTPPLSAQIVLSKIKARICPTLRHMPSGGAAVSLPVLHFFEDIGIPVCEGYGLTETSPVVTTGNNGWANRRLGCVGAWAMF